MRPSGPRSLCIRCAWCDGYPCLVHAKSDAEVIGGAALSSSMPNVTLLVNAEVVKLETDAVRARGDRGGRRARRQPGGLFGRHRRRLRRAQQQRQDPAAIGQRPATQTVWPTAPTRSAATTCSTTARRWRPWARSSTRPSSRRRSGINDFYLGRRRAASGRSGNIQMIGKSNAGAMKGEEPKLTLLAPRWSLDDVAEHSVDWWLTTEDLPIARQPGDSRQATGTSIWLTQPTNDKEADGLYEELKKHPQPRRAGPAPRAGQELLHGYERPYRRRSPPGRARAGSGRTRPPPSSTSTARPTSSTTSMSSTPASSRVSAP